MADDQEKPHGSPSEVRVMRVIVSVVLVLTVIGMLPALMAVKIPQENDIYVGMVIGFVISKAGTIIDWLFGGSESGSRRTDTLVQRSMPNQRSMQIGPVDTVNVDRNPAPEKTDGPQSPADPPQGDGPV